MSFADLHVHSIYSYDGTSTIPAILKHAAARTNLKVLAITDHDTIRGVREAQDLAPRYGLEVIPGCEISTRDGHLLALFIENPIKPDLPLLDTVLALADQGGICVAAHPYARGMNSLTAESIRKVVAHPRAAQCLVGVEVFNACLIYPDSNIRALAAAQQLGLAKTGSSDAHVLSAIGRGATGFLGDSAADLRKALIERQTYVHRGPRQSRAEIIAGYLPRIFLRKLGWAAWNANPQEPLTYIRYARTLTGSV
jgi:predicted metal-dependent phosphoesterase TrpH